MTTCFDSLIFHAEYVDVIYQRWELIKYLRPRDQIRWAALVLSSIHNLSDHVRQSLMSVTVRPNAEEKSTIPWRLKKELKDRKKSKNR